MKKFVNYSTFICVLFFLVLFTSCEPKYPKDLKYKSANDLKYHPKDANGNPEGYKAVYMLTGINSVDYVKKTDLEKYNKEKKIYEDYKRKKVLKDEYNR